MAATAAAALGVHFELARGGEPRATASAGGSGQRATAALDDVISKSSAVTFMDPLTLSRVGALSAAARASTLGAQRVWRNLFKGVKFSAPLVRSSGAFELDWEDADDKYRAMVLGIVRAARFTGAWHEDGSHWVNHPLRPGSPSRWIPLFPSVSVRNVFWYETFSTHKIMHPGVWGVFLRTAQLSDVNYVIVAKITLGNRVAATHRILQVSAPDESRRRTPPAGHAARLVWPGRGRVAAGPPSPQTPGTPGAEAKLPKWADVLCAVVEFESAEDALGPGLYEDARVTVGLVSVYGHLFNHDKFHGALLLPVKPAPNPPKEREQASTVRLATSRSALRLNCGETHALRLVAAKRRNGRSPAEIPFLPS